MDKLLAAEAKVGAYSCKPPMENPYCSCKLTRRHGLQLQPPYGESLPQL